MLWPRPEHFAFVCDSGSLVAGLCRLFINLEHQSNHQLFPKLLDPLKEESVAGPLQSMMLNNRKDGTVP